MDGKIRILVVEDDEDISMVEQIYLENSGYEVHVEASGDNVIRLLEQEPFDLILLDLMLPGKDGYEICREVREKYDMPILMVTARTESMEKIRGLNIGADDYIIKPFEPAELVARVRANLRQYSRNLSRQSKKLRMRLSSGTSVSSPAHGWSIKAAKKSTFPIKSMNCCCFWRRTRTLSFLGNS